MSQLALQLIDEAFEKKSTFLDLGHCGLTAVPPEIVKLKDHLEHLSLGSLFTIDKIRKRSANTSISNQFAGKGSLDILSQLPKLKSLSVAYCKLTDGPIEYISSLSKLTSLDISANSLKEKSAEYISRLARLTSLDISFNNIGEKGAEYISSLSNLASLVIIHNTLGDNGAEYISSISNLTSLNINSNFIEDKGAEYISRLTNLTSLDISSNNIGENGAEYISRLSNLTSLDIAHNYIGENGAEYISRLSNLTILEIGDNVLRGKGTEYIGRLSNLTSLGIQDNNLGEKSAEYISKLSNLTSLDTSFNNLGVKGAEYISRLPKLTSLKVFSNNLGVKGAEYISRLSNLTSLNIRNNNLGGKGAEYISRLTGLTSLDIPSNSIGGKGLEYISRLTNLTFLDISNNNLGGKGAEYISRLTNLTSLDINYNNLGVKGAEYISKLTSLTSLKISNNNIGEKGASHLALLKNLRHLVLINNQIEALPHRLIQDLALEIDLESEAEPGKILLKNNPIKNPPPEVLAQGRTAILEYLEGTSSPLNECKLIFIGDGAVGKTSLMKRLVYETFDAQEKTTHGINKIAWRKLSNERGEAIKVNLWDFGGQHIQHSLHQFFFTERVIYVLVLNPRNDEKAPYWLDQVEKLGKDSKCLVVYNWKDEKDKEANYLGNFYELRKTYPRLPEPILLSCATGHNMGVFEDAIKTAVLQNEGLRTLYPNKWFEIKAKLEQGIPIERNYIEYPEYERWCMEKDYNDPDRRKNLLRILDSIGSIVFFDKPVLNQLQVLNPEWITTGAYAILTSERTRETKGHLKWDDLVEIFREEKEIFSDRNIKIKYTEQQFQFILQLMLDYRLCQKNPLKDHEYLIPSAFGEQPQRDYHLEMDGGRQYRFQFKSPFEMLIMHRFIAKNIVHIIGQDYWNSGIYFKHSGSETYALVETNLHSRQINCWIKGENVRGLWEVIRNDFRETFKAYHNFPVTEEVLYAADGRSTFLPYKEMLDALRNGVTVIEYHPTYQLKNINVLHVLELFESREQTFENVQNLKVEVNPHIHVNPQVNVNPQVTASPNVTMNPQITNTVQTEKVIEREPSKPQPSISTEEEKQKLKAWQREAAYILLMVLALTVLLILMYNRELLLSPATWSSLKEQGIWKWAGIVAAFVWNGFIGKLVYDRYYDPSKKKAFIDNLRHDGGRK
jgi:internalin A